MSKYLIIGNSAAAAGAISGIRKVDAKGEITVVSKEPYLAYSRPALSHYLCGEVSDENMYYCREEFYSRNNVKLRLGKKAVRISPEEKKVSLDDGETVAYTKLLLASGGSPIRPKIKGDDKGGIYAFVEWDDVKKLNERLTLAKDVVVLGGGLIGLNAGYGLSKRGCRVTIVELADRLLSPVLDATASGLVRQEFEKAGVKVLTKVTIDEILGSNEYVEKVKLSDGQILNCDILVIAIGVRPDLSLLQGSGIETGRGVLVNEYMQTNSPDIYAAGDITEAYDILHEKRRVSPIWPNATTQGYYAGLNMAGNKSIYQGNLDLNSLQFYGMEIIAVGFGNAEGNGFEVQKSFSGERNSYKRLVFKGDLLAGAILVRAIDKAGIYTNLIRRKENVSSFKEKLLQDDFGLISLPDSIYRRWLNGEAANTSMARQTIGNRC